MSRILQRIKNIQNFYNFQFKNVQKFKIDKNVQKTKTIYKFMNA